MNKPASATASGWQDGGKTGGNEHWHRTAFLGALSTFPRAQSMSLRINLAWSSGKLELLLAVAAPASTPTAPAARSRPSQQQAHNNSLWHLLPTRDHCTLM